MAIRSFDGVVNCDLWDDNEYSFPAVLTDWERKIKAPMRLSVIDLDEDLTTFTMVKLGVVTSNGAASYTVVANQTLGLYPAEDPTAVKPTSSAFFSFNSSGYNGWYPYIASSSLGTRNTDYSVISFCKNNELGNNFAGVTCYMTPVMFDIGDARCLGIILSTSPTFEETASQTTFLAVRPISTKGKAKTNEVEVIRENLPFELCGNSFLRGAKVGEGLRTWYLDAALKSRVEAYLEGGVLYIVRAPAEQKDEILEVL